MADKNIQLKTLDGNKLYPATKASLILDLPVYNMAGKGDSKLVRYYIFTNSNNIKRFTTVNVVSDNVNVFYLNSDNQMELYSSKGKIQEDTTTSDLVLIVNDEPTINYIYDKVNLYNVVDTNQYKIAEKTTPNTGFTHTYDLIRLDSEGQEIVVSGSEVNISGDTKLESATTFLDTEDNNKLKVKYQLGKYDGDTKIEELGTMTNTLFIVGRGLKIIQTQNDYGVLSDYELQVDLTSLPIGKGLKFDTDTNEVVVNAGQGLTFDDNNKLTVNLTTLPGTETLEDKDNKILTASGKWIYGVTYDTKLD